MKFKDPEIEKIYDHLSQISRKAYKDPYLISNIVLSKEDAPKSILESYLTRKAPPKITLLFAIKKLILYGIKNMLSFARLVFTKILHRISGQRVQLKEKGEKGYLNIFRRFFRSLFLIFSILKAKLYNKQIYIKKKKLKRKM